MPDRPSSTSSSMEWLVRGEHDLQSARLLLQQDGPTDTIAILLQQAVEKHLKGYLLSRGWKLRRTHDLEVLVSEAVSHDKAFEPFLQDLYPAGLYGDVQIYDDDDLARVLSACYIEARYPPGPPREYPKKEMTNMLGETEQLIARIRQRMSKP